MTQDVASTAAITIPDRDALAKKSGLVFKVLLIGAIGFAAYVFLLPFLLSIVWGTIELAIGIPIALFLIYTLTKKEFWRALSYFSEAIARGLLSIAIEMNKWQILLDQVEERAKALENVKTQNAMLRGEQATTTKAVADNDAQMKESWEEMNILKAKIKAAKSQDEVDDLTMKLETSSTNFTNAKGFIDDTKPILNGLNTLVTTTDKIYRKGTNTINNLKATIKSLKLRYDISSSGSKAIRSATIALTGNPATQADADKAFDSITKQIGMQLGVITQGIQMTTQIMDATDLKDAAKVAIAAKVADNFNVDDKFNYSDSLHATDTIGIPTSTSGNKFLDYLK